MARLKIGYRLLDHHFPLWQLPFWEVNLQSSEQIESKWHPDSSSALQKAWSLANSPTISGVEVDQHSQRTALQLSHLFIICIGRIRQSYQARTSPANVGTSKNVPDSAEEQWENKGFVLLPIHNIHETSFHSGCLEIRALQNHCCSHPNWPILVGGPILRNPHTTQPRLTVNLVKVRYPHHNMFWNPRKKLQKSDIQYESVNIYFSFLRWYYLYVYIYMISQIMSGKKLCMTYDSWLWLFISRFLTNPSDTSTRWIP